MKQICWRKGTAGLLIGVVFFSTLFLGCIEPLNNSDINNSEVKDTLIWVLRANADIDPYSYSGESLIAIIPNIFDGLVEFDEIFRIEPALAVSWSTLNDTTWRFYLRTDVLFHDGNGFTAEDVKYSFDKYYIGVKPHIKEVVIVDNFTVDILTEGPYPGLLQLLAHNIFMYSKQTIEADDEDAVVGTGPYRFVEFVEGNYTKLERFEGYWGDLPGIKTVIFRVISDDTERVDELATYKVDIIEYNVEENLSEIIARDNVNIVLYPPLSTYIIGFDVRENNSFSFPDGENPTADVRVRKAIYHAINITPLISGPFQGLAKPASQMITPYIFGYNPDIKRLEYNRTRAQELLADAGYEDGFDIELDCITYLYEYNAINCRMIADQLAEVGINVSLNELSADEFIKKVVSEKNTSMWLVGWGTISVDGGFVYDLFLRTDNESYNGYYNSGHYSNPEVDRIGEEAFREMDAKKRINLLQDGFRIALVDDVMVVPLFSQELFVLAADNVVYQPRADQRIFIKDISFIS